MKMIFSSQSQPCLGGFSLFEINPRARKCLLVTVDEFRILGLILVNVCKQEQSRMSGITHVAKIQNVNVRPIFLSFMSVNSKIGGVFLFIDATSGGLSQHLFGHALPVARWT